MAGINSRQTERTLVKRYMSRSHALEAIVENKLALVDPIKWKDKNDVMFVNLFRNHKLSSSVHLACFTLSPERHHHWSSFASIDDTVCLEFDMDILEKSIKQKSEFIIGNVKYKYLEEIEETENFTIDHLPFLKRIGFVDESEWRILRHGPEEQTSVYNVPIDIRAVNRIIISPNTRREVARNIIEKFKSVISSQKKYTHITVVRSRLTNSPRWQTAGNRIAKSKD